MGSSRHAPRDTPHLPSSGREIWPSNFCLNPDSTSCQTQHRSSILANTSEIVSNLIATPWPITTCFLAVPWRVALLWSRRWSIIAHRCKSDIWAHLSRWWTIAISRCCVLLWPRRSGRRADAASHPGGRDTKTRKLWGERCVGWSFRMSGHGWRNSAGRNQGQIVSFSQATPIDLEFRYTTALHYTSTPKWLNLHISRLVELLLKIWISILALHFASITERMTGWTFIQLLIQ